MKLEPRKELIGDKITLKTLDVTFENAKIMHKAKVNNQEHISPWLHWALPEFEKSPEVSYGFIQRNEKKWNEGSNFEYAIFENDTGNYIGGLGLARSGMFEYMQYEIGYWLVKDACGKNYMTEAVKLAEKEFFGLGAERLIIRAEIENIGSNKVAEKLGYIHEGVLRNALYNHAYNEFRNVNIYSKLKDEYTDE